MPFLRLRTPIVLGLLLLAVIGSVLYVIRTRPVHAPPVPPSELARLEWEATPRPVPAIGFAAAGGKRSTLAAFAGHYVLLDLWATWCAPCVRELPQLARLQSALPGLVVVPINVGRDNAVQTAAFLQAHGAATLAAYVDSDAAFIRAFNAPGLPVSVLIDPEGHQIARALGPCDWGTPAAIAYLRRLIAPAAPSS
jgi:thiol-disulfide isomerase/thioredoxin